MSLPVNTIIEVRSTGSDSNGGGFVAGSSGTDYSQQNSAQFSGTDLATTSGTTNPSVVTSGSHSFTSADVGNLIQISAGTNWTTGFYQVVSVASGAATLDRAVGTSATLSGGTWALGGALATPQMAFTNFIGSTALSSELGIIIYIKAATYTTSSGFTTGSYVTGSGVITRIIGYDSVRGDGGQATLQAAANNLTLFTLEADDISNRPYSFENIIFDGDNTTTSTGVVLNNAAFLVFLYNCVFQRFTGPSVLTVSASTLCDHCDFINNAFSATDSHVIGGVGPIILSSCYFADNTATGTCQVVAGGGYIDRCIFYNNTGGTSFDVLRNYANVITNSIFHANSSSAIDGSQFLTDTGVIVGVIIQNNIFTNNGGYGIVYDMPSSSMVVPGISNNAFYNNTSGNQSGFTSMGGDVTLTGLPYNNVPTDFGLNNTSGAGAACRGAGVPGTIGAASVVGTGYLDIGALQHQCVTGSGGMIGEWFGN